VVPPSPDGSPGAPDGAGSAGASERETAGG
jgi:hypothetical protein